MPFVVGKLWLSLPANLLFMIKSRLQSFTYALKGWVQMLRSEPNARIHLIATLAVILAGWHFNISREEWRWLIFCIVGVLGAESFNTAVESIVDLVSPEYHPLAGKAKDTAAGAVLFVAMGAVIIGANIFLPYLLALARQAFAN